MYFNAKIYVDTVYNNINTYFFNLNYTQRELTYLNLLLLFFWFKLKQRQYKQNMAYS